MKSYRKIAGKYKGPCLIVGSGRCLWDDLREFRDWRHPIIAINHAGMYLPMPVTHWFSQHANILPLWRTLRRHTQQQKNTALLLHSDSPHNEIDYQWPHLQELPYRNGTSALAAAIMALEMGYDRVTMAGTPYDGSGHFYDPPDRTTVFGDFNLEAWEWAQANHFRGRVTAVSGRLVEVLT